MPDSPPSFPFQSRWFERALAALFLAGQVVMHILQGKIHRRNLMEQMVIVGPGSVMPVVPISFFTGMIIAIQTARSLDKYGAL